MVPQTFFPTKLLSPYFSRKILYFETFSINKLVLHENTSIMLQQKIPFCNTSRGKSVQAVQQKYFPLWSYWYVHVHIEFELQAQKNIRFNSRDMSIPTDIFRQRRANYIDRKVTFLGYLKRILVQIRTILTIQKIFKKITLK